MSTDITRTNLRQFALGADTAVLAPIMDAEAKRVEINTPLRLAHWLSQLSVESAGLRQFEENLNYSAERLIQVWPRRFPTDASTIGYAHNPAALGEKVYGGRAELGNVNPGDGGKFIGRGLIQITGRANYERAAGWTGLDLLAYPPLAAVPANAVKIAADFWRVHKLNDLADRDDVEAVTKVVNGGLNGLDDRRRQLGRAKTIWGVA